MAAMEQLVDRWMSDSVWREELRTNPEEALQRSGADLDETDWEMIRSIDWSASDGELEERLSKC
jgi:hypothetical protein